MSSRIKSKTALSKITEKDILYFGLDYLRLNIGDISESKSKHKSIQFLDAMFKYPHNHENTDRLENFVWADTGEIVEVVFREIDMGEVAEINPPNAAMAFRIIKISPKWAKNIEYKYRYQIDCYGKFFHSHRQKILDINDYLGIFIDEVKLPISISRVDICVDIVGVSPTDIRNCVAMNGNSKNWSFIKADKDSSNAQTIYYGDPTSSNNTWFARIYNKTEDCIKKGKIKGYEEYLNKEEVTRLELEIHTGTCDKYQISIPEILDKNVAWGIFYQLLYKERSPKWAIAKKLNTIFRKQGFKKYVVTRKELSKKTLARLKYLKRTTSMMSNSTKTYGQSAFLYLQNHLEFIKEEQGFP